MKNSFFNLSSSNINGRIVRVMMWFAIIIIICILHVFLKSNFGIAIPCVFRELTGFYCPGCGVTRMLESIAKLNLYQAFRYNVLVMTLMPLFIVCGVNSIYCYIIGKSSTIYNKIPNKVWVTLLVVALLFGILRNIEPFDFLAPTSV